MKLSLHNGQYFWLLLQASIHLLWKKWRMSHGSAIVFSPGLKFSRQNAHSSHPAKRFMLKPLSLSVRILNSRCLPICSCCSINCKRAYSSASRAACYRSRISCNFCSSCWAMFYRSASSVMSCFLATFLSYARYFLACLRFLAFILRSSSPSISAISSSSL